MNKRILALTAMTFGVLGVAVGTIVLVRAQKEPSRTPQVISTSAPIEVLATQFEDRNQSRSEPTAKISLRNNSDKTIIAFNVEAGNKKDVDGYGEVRISDDSGPVAGPKAEFTIDVPIGNFKTGMPLRINAIVFEDGSSAGEDRAVAELKKAVEKALKNKGRRIDPE